MTKKFSAIAWGVILLAIGLNVLIPTIVAYVPALFKLALSLAVIAGVVFVGIVAIPRIIKWLKDHDNH